MTDNNIDPDLLPDARSFPLERAVLFAPVVVATLGFGGYLVATYASPPAPITQFHWLGASVLVYGLGVGALAALLNLYANPVATRGRARKALVPYTVVLALVAPLTAAGAFDPTLAIVFLTFLAGFGILYAIVHVAHARRRD